MCPRSAILKTSERETMTDIKQLIAKNILLEAKIEDQKAEIAELRRLLKNSREMAERQATLSIASINVDDPHVTVYVGLVEPTD